MNPAIGAAWIAAGVGILTLAVTVYIAGRTIKAANETTAVTIKAERAKLFWERQSAAYVDTLSHLLKRQTMRDAAFSGDPGPTELRLRQLINISKKVSESEGQLLAYGTSEIYGLYQDIHDADQYLLHRFYEWEAAERHAASKPGDLHYRPGSPTPQEELDALHKAIGHAREAEQAVIDAIRKDLRSQPDLR